jgi:uncharacterized protein YjdB
MLHRLIALTPIIMLAACSGDSSGPVNVSSLAVNPSAASVTEGASVQFAATPLDANSKLLTGRTVTWQTSNAAIATVSETGLVTGVAPGMVTITATCEGKSITAQVTVTSLVATVAVAPAVATVVVGGTVQLGATPRDAQGNALSGRTVAWQTGNGGVATVTAGGLVTGLAAGVVQITATSDGKSGTAAITVVPSPVATVTVGPAATTLNPTGTAQLTVTLRDASGATLTGRTITWQSSNNAVATVSATGLVTAVAAGGPVTITATCEGKSGAALVTVFATVGSVTVTPATVLLALGGSAQLTAIVRDAQGNTLTGRSVVWTSSDVAVVTVSATGLVNAVAEGGPVTITATSERVAGTASVTVQGTVFSVTLNGTRRVKVGDEYIYTATAKKADGTVVDRPTTWSVADPTTATITQVGMLTPLKTGTITLQVTIDGVVWETSLTAYDWYSYGSYPTLNAVLPSDVLVYNRYGTSEYPELLVGCSSGSLVISVTTEHFVTANGNVSYGFEFAAPVSRTWLESSDFSALTFHEFPYTNETKLAFLNNVAGSRLFFFAFMEFQGPEKSMHFRVTGLRALLDSMLPACQLTSPNTAGLVEETTTEDYARAVEASLTAVGRPAAVRADAAWRAGMGAQNTPRPVVHTATQPASAMRATRRR